MGKISDLYQVLFQHTKDGVFIANNKGDILDTNPAFLDMLGYSSKAMQKIKAVDLLVEPDEQTKLFALLQEQDEVRDYLLRLRRKDGTVLEALHTISVQKGKNGRVQNYVSLVRDITEHHQADALLAEYERSTAALRKNEEESREFQQKLQILQEANLELSRLDDLDTIYKRAIQIGHEKLGFERLGLLLYEESSGTLRGTFGIGESGEYKDERDLQQEPGGAFLNLFQADRRTVLWDDVPLYTNGKVTGHGWNAVAVLWDGNQGIGWLTTDNFISGKPPVPYMLDILTLYGDTIGHLITRKRTERLTRQQENLLRLVLDTIPQAVFWKDRTSVYLGSNHNFARDAGVPSPEALVGKTDYDFAWSKEQADFFRKVDQEVMTSGQPQLGIIEPQTQADGKQAWLETNKVPLYDSAGEVIGILGTYEDITERKQAEVRREQLQVEVQETLKRREREVALATQIAQETASAADLTDLYRRVVTQIHEQFDYYYTQLLRYDPAMQTLALSVGYGEVGEKMLELHHSVPIGIGLIGQAAATGKSILVSDLGDIADHRSNPLLPAARGELAVPIKLGNEILGVLDVQSDVAGALNENDQLVLEGLCGQVAVAIESTTLRQEMESRLRELNALQRQMSREGWKEYQASRRQVSGYQFSHAGAQPFSIDALPATNVPATNGQTKKAKSNGDATITAITPVSTPLQVKGETIGFLGIQPEAEQPLTAEETEFLTAVSRELAEALEAARLFEQTQDSLAQQERLTAELETVAQVSTAASTILEAEALLQAVVDLAKTSFNLYHVHIYLLNETGRKLVLKAGAGNVGRLMALEGREINMDTESLISRAARTRQGVMENQVRKTVDFLPHPLLPHTQAEIAVPLIVGDKLIGVLDLQSDKADNFTQEDLKIQRTLASQIAIALENARQYAEQVETSAKLRELDRLKSEFLASMSHELRTPLNSIIGFADVLLEGLDGELNDRMEEDVRLIRESGRHLRELIGEILDMSKIEAGRMELRYEEIDMRQLAQDIMATAAPLIQEKNLDMYLDLDETLPTVRADRTRLRQILWNIMGNAIKFTEQGSVSLSMHDQGEHVLIAIRDTGIGIREENIAIVFEQFRQIDGGLNRVVGGTGLGLPITKKLVEIHGGEIWIESTYGQGTTFFFTLPYFAPEFKPGTGPLL